MEPLRITLARKQSRLSGIDFKPLAASTTSHSNLMSIVHLQWHPDSPAVPLVSPIALSASLKSHRHLSHRLLLHTGPLRLRPSTSLPASRALPLLTSTHHHQLQARYASSTPPVPTEEPARKAQSIIDALPGSSLISKTAILSTGAGVSIWAIANEIYVVNEETIVAFATLSVIAGIFRYMVGIPLIFTRQQSFRSLSPSPLPSLSRIHWKVAPRVKDQC